MGAGPYQTACWTYWQAGWVGVIPLPAGQKGPPPRGYTGWAGVDPSGADVQAWADGREGAGNIGLRIPAGVYGLDVDDYGGKSGGAALDRLVREWGALPPTWIVSSREDSASGIRLYRATPAVGSRWRDEPGGHGAGIEAIHYGHRYAVVAPSMHPETGRKYVWRRPDGMPAGDGEVPGPGRDLPELPAAWVAGLSEAGEARTGEMAGHAETLELVHGWRTGEQACARVREAHERSIAGLAHAADGAALHPAARDAVHELCNLGHEGHTRARAALAEHYSRFVEIRAGRDGADRRAAEAEWWRLVRGAIGKLHPDAGRAVCDCELWTGAGLAFEYERGPDKVDESSISGPRSPEVGEVAAPVDLADELIARMLTAADLRDRPAPLALIEGLLTLDSASWLIARSGSYKSFIALDWAAHVADGRAWHGRAAAGGPVLYMVAEGVSGMGPRIRAWEQRNGPMSSRLRFLPMPVQIARADHWAALVEACKRLAPVMVVLDTQARITVGLDENDNTAMGEMVEAIERLRRACGACVLVVHHIGRNGADARGASAIDAAQDTELRLTRTADLRVVLEIDKSRHGPDDVRVELELFPAELDGGGSSLVVGPPLSAVTVPDWRANLTLNQRTLAQVMSDIFPDHGATKAELKAETRKRVRQPIEGKVLEPVGESAFRRAWDALVTGGRFARVAGSQRYLLRVEIEGESE